MIESYTFKEFKELIGTGAINEFDGMGYFASEDKETNFAVNLRLFFNDMQEIPPMCDRIFWYSK